MATVFMRWLETTPEDYERGMRLLTLGRLDRVRLRISEELERDPGQGRVLVVGSGTGRLSATLAAAGHQVHAIDTDPRMVAATTSRLAAARAADHATSELLDVRRLPAAAHGSYDAVIAVLVLSETDVADRPSLLAACRAALRSGGRLLLADEVVPHGARRLPYHAVRVPLVLATWLLTRSSSRPMSAAGAELAAAGFVARRIDEHLGGSLVLFEARPAAADQRTRTGTATAVPPTPTRAAAVEPASQTRAATDAARSPLARPEVRELVHAPSLGTLLRDAWALFFRVVPPYPGATPGLYAIGRPGRDSPVLVTGNYDLTVRRLARDLCGRVNAWLLVVDSGSVNVWCAAGSGRLNAGKVLAAIVSSRLADTVDHRSLVLPQLAAVGVDGQEVLSGGWDVQWGPIRATDLPAYIDRGAVKTDSMREVRFPLRDRLEMASATLGLYALMILIPVWLLWREAFWPVAVALVGLSYTYAVLLPVLPGRDGLAKSVPLAALALAGMLLHSVAQGDTSAQVLFGRTLGLVALSVFVGAELQGMSPRMRGEQANWLVEGIVFATLLAIYLVAPSLAGWR